MALFLSLYLGHLIADYALQPGVLVKAKRESLPALLLHIALIGAATTLVLWDHALYYWPLIVFAMGAHLVIEKLTIAARVGTPTRGLFVFLFDQTLHLLSLALLVWLAGQWDITPGAQLLWFNTTPTTLAIVDAFVTVTLLGSILAFEAGGAFLGDASHDTTILKFDLPRVLGMAERALALALALLVPIASISALVLILPFVPRIAFALTRGDGGSRTRLLVEAVTGFVLCALCYAGIMAVAALTRF